MRAVGAGPLTLEPSPSLLNRRNLNSLSPPVCRSGYPGGTLRFGGAFPEVTVLMSKGLQVLRPVRFAGLLGMIFISGWFCAGCQEQLFSPTEPRSQYDRFDAVRDRRADAYIEDEFGNKRPNLRGRLVKSE